MDLAPIVVFGFIRVSTLKEVIDGLKKNPLSLNSELFIFLDGTRSADEKKLTNDVLNYCKGISGFKTVSIKQSEENEGLDPSVINGVTEIVNQYGKVIVLEDDVVPTTNFLDYMNQCLTVFEQEKKIMSISGWGIELEIPSDYKYDAYLFGRSSSWGWATWKDRWNSIDWVIPEWNNLTLFSKWELKKQINKYGGGDMYRMLKHCMEGGGMWDIRFCYSMFKLHKYSVVPVKSKTQNIGFDGLAVHCKPEKYKRYKVSPDTSGQSSFKLDKNIDIDKRIVKQRLRVSSTYIRIITKLKNKLL